MGLIDAVSAKIVREGLAGGNRQEADSLHVSLGRLRILLSVFANANWELEQAPAGTGHGLSAPKPSNLSYSGTLIDPLDYTDVFRLCSMFAFPDGSGH